MQFYVQKYNLSLTLNELPLSQVLESIALSDKNMNKPSLQ
jgi:hypothetical protein